MEPIIIDTKTKAVVYIILLATLSIPAWFYLFFHDWKLALAILAILTSSRVESRLKYKVD